MWNQLSSFDTKLSKRLSLPLESIWWRGARIVAHMGDGPYVFSSLILVYLLSWWWSDTFLRQADVTVAVIVVAAILIVTSIKFTVRRQRPAPPGEFVTFRYDLYSFPSGHSARMAALAVGALFFYPSLGWILLLVTLGVAAARVAVGVHYVGDILAGLGTGAVVAWAGMTFLLALV
jgi:undecaprenyl-diphosphatase